MSDARAIPEKKRAFETHDLVVAETVNLTPRNKGLRFHLPAGKTLSFRAGQFCQMFIPLGEKVRRTCYSIASAPTPDRGEFELCVTLVDGGMSSTYLHNLKAGDRIQSMAPLGTFRFIEDGRDSVFIATGSGIAPFRSMILDQLARGTQRELYLLFGNRYEPDIIYRDQWESLFKKHPNFKYFFTLSRADWPGPKGYVQDKIAEFVPRLTEKNFYICGLVNMINAVREKLLALGVPEERIHFERYD
jgi:ferredoxin-NADP reductase